MALQSRAVSVAWGEALQTRASRRAISSTKEAFWGWEASRAQTVWMERLSGRRDCLVRSVEMRSRMVRRAWWIGRRVVERLRMSVERLRSWNLSVEVRDREEGERKDMEEAVEERLEVMDGETVVGK